TYRVRLSVGDEVQEREFEILPDPRSESTLSDLIAQFEFIQDVNDKVSEAHEVIIEIRDVRQQMKDLKQRLGDEESVHPIRDQVRMIDSVMTEVEQALYQTKNQSRQDPLNFPIRLTNKLAHLNSLNRRGSFRPTEQSYEVKEALTREIDGHLSRYYNVRSTQVPELNRLVREQSVDAIMMKKDKPVN
ncbi:MAG: glycosyl hydrolase, partial [Saprospiraceae bacterium]|nr:glycosyl hydrolase [Saprospiraceae bacterium]